MSENLQSGSNLVLAADLGGTHLRVALVNDHGEILAHVKRPTPRDDNPEVIVNALIDGARECGANDRFAGLVRSASIMVPGAVDMKSAVVVQAPNLPSLKNFALKDALEKKLRLSVLLENDANAAAVGEMWMGAARGYRSVICVTLGTGVGGGIILDGQLWRGAHGTAGEIGHTTVDPHGTVKCKCGNTGCLEMFASATAIVRMTKELRATIGDSKLNFDRLTAANVFEAGVNGDVLALEVFKRVGSYLGIGLANLINLLDPEIIVIAGGAVNGWSLFEKDMHAEVNERAFKASVAKVKIAQAECGDNAGLLGATRLALDLLN